MKHRVWVSSPIYLVLAVIMLVMACFSFPWSRAVFAIEMGLAVVAVMVVLISNFYFRSYVGTSVKAAEKVLSLNETSALQQFTMPVALSGPAGDVVWVNDAFINTISPHKECRGENVLRFIYPHTLEQILKNAGTDVTIDQRQYTVFAAKTKLGCLLYFIDDTYYKEINREYVDRHPVVCLAYFDNREELARDISSSEDNRIASEVENVLFNWAQSMGGFSYRINNGRYLILSDEMHIREEMEHRFQILDTIRNIRSADHRSATVSIGIGRGANSQQASEEWARRALDMALGRGGDQVAVKQKDDSYEFFGGLSKGVEKHDKVRTRVIAATLSDRIRQSDTVLIMGHKFSDLDAIGSSIGLWSAITRALQKPAYVVVNEAQSLAGPLIQKMNDDGEGDCFLSPNDALALVSPRTLLVVMDTHSPEFVESPELLKAVSKVVVIDHHRLMVKHIENAVVFYHEPYASSTSEMVAELVQYIGENVLTRTEAEALLAGIMLDTKSFSLKTGVRTFEAAAYLRRRGADTVTVKRLFSDSFDTYKTKYRIVSSADLLDGCAVAYTEQELPNLKIASAQAADELLTIEGVMASFVIYPSDGVMNVSARSMGDMNVQLVMEAMGGGGHLTMAGAQMKDATVEQVRSQLIEILRAGIGRGTIQKK